MPERDYERATTVVVATGSQSYFFFEDFFLAVFLAAFFFAGIGDHLLLATDRCYLDTLASGMSRAGGTVVLRPQSSDDARPKLRGSQILLTAVADASQEALLEDEVVLTAAAFVEVRANLGELHRRELPVQVRVEALQTIGAVHRHLS